jgi:hypothetical protein
VNNTKFINVVGISGYIARATSFFYEKVAAYQRFDRVNILGHIK